MLILIDINNYNNFFFRYKKNVEVFRYKTIFEFSKKDKYNIILNSRRLF